ncbi:MAG: methylenetetrahydrofolate--tRNA-(uracil(54)-C(5))-methyltransferase (FADH(2)-oxidizing) TrmFO [Ruminococcaceae bacterium]|nr:methylenetetrahydrofolate--tRNA-(uracil(54)-C(5))-methyltransferase (FADH(2)-oxidizing) TrmFO [Oscillospiraceae bacterium]
MSRCVDIYGAGLAGCEAAWQCVRHGIPVRIHEMKPKKSTPAHRYHGFAELVCSNSLRSGQVFNAIGLLKEELFRIGSLIMEAAYANEVPAGAALAVDREKFSDYITEKIRNHPLITVIEEEVTAIPNDPDAVIVVATGPLTSDALSADIARLTGADYLHFYDAAAPIVDAASINMDRAWEASRYDKGEAAYINCPMTREEYTAFYQALITAKEAALHDFDQPEDTPQKKDGGLTVFEGCMPVEVMARRGVDTLLYGPLKPVGLPDPRTGREPYAVVQLRQENTEKTMYNLVGFQTHLTWDEQRRVFGMIPGLEHAEFLRYGVMHRNTFMNSPKLLSSDYSMRSRPNLFFAGQMTGVEGYIESTGSGYIAGVNAARRILGQEPLYFPRETVLGAMAAYISDERVTDFQPMNANFGLMPQLGCKVRGGKRGRNDAFAQRALDTAEKLVANGLLPSVVLPARAQTQADPDSINGENLHENHH